MISLRFATEQDEDKFWRWQNDVATRRASFDNRYITDSENREWYTKTMADKNTETLIIVLDNEIDMGWLLLKYDGSKRAEIVIGVDKNFRGKGYGQKAIGMACDRAKGARGVETIFANVKIDNYKALFAFDKVGFRDCGEGKSDGIEYVRFEYP